MAIAFLGLLEALAIAKWIANQTHQTLDFNRQYLAEGPRQLLPTRVRLAVAFRDQLQSRGSHTSFWNRDGIRSRTRCAGARPARGLRSSTCGSPSAVPSWTHHWRFVMQPASRKVTLWPRNFDTRIGLVRLTASPIIRIIADTISRSCGVRGATDQMLRFGSKRMGTLLRSPSKIRRFHPK